MTAARSFLQMSARLVDTQQGTPAAHLDLVRFLDGQEAAGVAVDGDVEAFRRRWRRPKWATVEHAWRSEDERK